MTIKPMRLVREQIDTRQQKALEAIQKQHDKDGWEPIVRTFGGKALPTDAILRESYRKTDEEL